MKTSVTYYGATMLTNKNIKIMLKGKTSDDLRKNLKHKKIERPVIFKSK